MIKFGVVLLQRVKVVEHDLFSFILIRHFIIRLSHWHKQLKTAQVITIAKTGEDPTDVTSYRPISLLPILSKVYEKLLLRRLHKDLSPDKWIPHHQFGFCQGHSTIQQIH
jgi:hypothetical protein